MDVEKLQRINDLARELMKHGMVNSMDEAVKMAEEKINGKPEISNIRNIISEDTLSKSQVSVSVDNPQPVAKDEIELKKMQNMMNEQAQTISTMSGKINELVSEFNKLQQEINRLKTIKVPTESVADKKSSQQSGTQAQLRSESTEKKEGHVRSGNYKSEDVSIEKVFYAGTR